jgi:hypothetical protein
VSTGGREGNSLAVSGGVLDVSSGAWSYSGTLELSVGSDWSSSVVGAVVAMVDSECRDGVSVVT